jgi:hypothetical protein
MSSELLSLNQQDVSPCFPNSKYGHHAVVVVNIKQQPKLTKQPKLSLGKGIWAKRFHVLGFGQRVLHQEPQGGLQDHPTVFFAEPAQIASNGVLDGNVPLHERHYSEDQDLGLGADAEGAFRIIAFQTPLTAPEPVATAEMSPEHLR